MRGVLIGCLLWTQWLYPQRGLDGQHLDMQIYGVSNSPQLLLLLCSILGEWSPWLFRVHGYMATRCELWHNCLWRLLDLLMFKITTLHELHKPLMQSTAHKQCSLPKSAVWERALTIPPLIWDYLNILFIYSL